jgi:hypothetical protein
LQTPLFLDLEIAQGQEHEHRGDGQHQEQIMGDIKRKLIQ